MADQPTSQPKKLYIETVGCQMNVLDSELVVARLRDDGYELTDDIDQADAILYNTCSVRHLARNAGSREHVTSSFDSYDADREPAVRPSTFQAYLRVMMGCDKFCTYCIVPSVRGPEQSRPPSAIVAEARLLAMQGVKEITLVGQTVNSYKHKEADGRITRLSDLLARLHDVDGVERIKFITSFPNDMTDDLLQAVRDLPKVSRYIHVPAQSGCDLVLKRMKRMYTAAFYEEMLARLRETIPGSSVSSDFIVGFCGETDESFEKTVGLLERSRFKNSFIFKYSPRTGTKADDLYPDDVPEEVKRRRNHVLLALQTRIRLEDNRAFIGREETVLVEGRSRSTTRKEGWEGPDQLTGRTHCDRIVVFDGPDELSGRLTRVRIENASAVTLFGRVADGQVAGP
ncbi:hypothetical protein HK102_009971, partial [Quaeritorhiza haematococci]